MPATIVPTEANVSQTVAVSTATAEPVSKQETVQVEVAPGLEQIKAARVQEQQTAAEAAAKQAEADKAAQILSAAEAEKAKQSEVETVESLKAKLAETQAQSLTLAEKAKQAELVDKAKLLIDQGKHWEASQVFKQIGYDFDKAVHELINPGEKPEPEAKQEPKVEASPEVKALMEKLEALEKRVQEADLKEAAAAKEAGRKSILSHVTEQKAAYPFLASNEAWVTDALTDADKSYAEKVAANKGEDIDQEAKNKIITDALTAAEAKHRTNAEQYQKILGSQAGSTLARLKSPNSVTVASPVLSLTGAPKAGITPVARTGKATSIDELKKARRSAN